MAAISELGLGVSTQSPYVTWNKWVETVDPHRPFTSLNYRDRCKGQISSKTFQQRLDKIVAMLGSSPKGHEAASFCIDHWATVCSQPPKKREIKQETIQDIQRLLVTDDFAWFLSRIKTEFVVLWALLNQGEFRQHAAGSKINKIALLKKHFSKELLDQVARSFFDEGFYYVALQFYYAIQKKEEAPFVNSQIGRCLHLLGQPAEAIEYFNRAHIQADDSMNFSAQEGFFLHLINLGDTYFDLHYSEKALAKYREALQQLKEHQKIFRDVKGKEDQRKRIQAWIALAALLLIRALDDESERKECFSDYELDAFWEDAEDLHKWKDLFSTTELCYRFFTAYKECGSFLDSHMGGTFMDYDHKKTKKLFPFIEAHPAAIRPLYRFFPDFYPEQSERLLILTSNFFVSHPAIAKIHRRRGLQEDTDPIVQQEHYKEALRAAKYHMHAQKRRNVIDQVNALDKLGDLYAFLGREKGSLEKTVKAWSWYKNALDLAFKNDLQIEGAKEQLTAIQTQAEELAKSRATDPAFQLARKLVKAERYPEASLYFMKALKDFTPEEDDSEYIPIHNDPKAWLKASLERISPPHNEETLETLNQLKKLLTEFRDKDLIRRFQEIL